MQSTITPPNATAWPSKYLLDEWSTTLAPKSFGLISAGVASVLSTKNKIPYFSLKYLNLSKSKTIIAGLATVSPKITFVLSSISLNI